MKIPLSWLREFTPVPSDISTTDLESAFVNVGFEIESIDVVGTDLIGPLVVAQVKSIEQLEGLKKPIRYVGLDCGEGEVRFVICGATNFSVDDLVVAALPGAILPGDFAISARETYGKTSNGMICSAKELRISEDHAGIIVLAPGSASVGEDAISLLQIKDVIIDVSILADRGYALSARGLARELAASLGLPYADPAQSVLASKYAIGSAGVQAIIEDPTAVSVIYLRTITGFNTSAPTPIWMRRRIEKCGMRSISLAVDVTNYVMLELGQPLHAFDRDKIEGSLHIRRAGSDQSLVTLDGQTRKLNPDDLMVADDKSTLALAGTMGGANSEISERTNSLVIEAARFDPISVAKNSRRHKLSSEASRRFERAVDPSLAELSSARAVDLLIEFGGATHLSSAKAGEPRYAPIVEIDPHYASVLLGTEISLATVESKLTIVGCDIEKISDTVWRIDPPSWRHDLSAPADFVEEVARLVGFDAIPSRLPIGKQGARLSPTQQRRRAVSTSLANQGYTEVMSSPFVSPEQMQTLGFVGDRAKAFKLANPMSEDFPLLRTHLLPGMLTTLQRNLARGAKDVSIFEVGSVFRNTTELPVAADISTATRPSDSQLAAIYANVPYQPTQIAGVVAANAELAGWWGSGRKFDWSDAVAAALRIIEETGNTATIQASDFAPWHTGRCAELLVAGKAVAHAGELHPRVISALNLPDRTCAFVVLLSELPFHEVTRAAPVFSMPAALQDISLIVSAEVSSQAVIAALKSGAGELLESITLFDRYDQLGDGKVSLAFNLTFRAPDRTLTAAEVSAFREAAGAAAAAAVGATIRS